MSVFRRKGKRRDEDVEELDAAELDHEQAPEQQPAPPPPRPQGPWDVQDAPDDGLERLDLGGLRIPIPPDTEVRVEVEESGAIVAATMIQGTSAMQINAFAAPRTTGIWDEVREEIAVTLRESSGRADEAEGPWGGELRAGVPTEGGALAAARFVGVDGPRWFLRALLTGPAATDESAAAPLLAGLRDVVVVRGNEAMAVRNILPLALPQGVAEQAAEAQAAATAEPDPSLEMPARGPEITETR